MKIIQFVFFFIIFTFSLSGFLKNKTKSKNINGIYKSINCNESSIIKIYTKNKQFNYSINNKSKGKIIYTKEGDDIYLEFIGFKTNSENNPKQNVSCLYKQDTLSFQCYGNSMNYYDYSIGDCHDKYIQFVKIK